MLLFYLLCFFFCNYGQMVEMWKNKEARKSSDEKSESELLCPEWGWRLMGPKCTNGDSSSSSHMQAQCFFFSFSCEIKCEGNMFCSACVGGGVQLVWMCVLWWKPANRAFLRKTIYFSSLFTSICMCAYILRIHFKVFFFRDEKFWAVVMATLTPPHLCFPLPSSLTLCNLSG